MVEEVLEEQQQVVVVVVVACACSTGLLRAGDCESALGQPMPPSFQMRAPI